MSITICIRTRVVGRLVEDLIDDAELRMVGHLLDLESLVDDLLNLPWGILVQVLLANLTREARAVLARSYTFGAWGRLFEDVRKSINFWLCRISEFIRADGT